jgi:hypothetical protein
VITQIFKVVFSAETLSEVLAVALESAAEQEAGGIEAQTDQVAAVILEIMQPPEHASFAAISASTFFTAAALAPALFIIRLAMHHWNRMLNEDDGLLRVFGDWLVAGFLAVSAGPFLDSVVQAGWWLAAAALGETQEIAGQFIAATSVTDTLINLSDPSRPSILAAVFWIAGGLGGLVGVIGLAAAFALAQAVLFILAVVAPVVAVLAVIPQMRWLRGLWLKAVAVLALLPVAAGGIFKAGVIFALSFGGKGFSDLFIRLFWLWGAVGFLLSLAGILGKVTLSAAVEATAKLGRGAREIVTTAALALNSSPAAVETARGQFSDRLLPRENVSFEGGLDAPQYVRNAPAADPTTNRSATGFQSSAGSGSLEPQSTAARLPPARPGLSAGGAGIQALAVDDSDAPPLQHSGPPAAELMEGKQPKGSGEELP